MVRKLTNLLILAVLVLMTSCDHKELCYHHPHSGKIRVVFDWKDAPEANPEGMCVFFYPEEGGEPIRVDFSGKTGGEVELTNGKYKIITYNNDTDGILFYGINDFFNHTFYTRDSNPLEPIYGPTAQYVPSKAEDEIEERVVLDPDMMWGCTATEVEITEMGVSYICVPESQKGQTAGLTTVSEKVITLYPHELTCIYTVEVRNVKNLSGMDLVSGILTGMAGELRMHDEQLSEECVSIPFAGRKSGTDKIEAQFITFGHNTANLKHHHIELFVVMNDKNKLHYYDDADGSRYDVNDQVENAPNKRRVHLIIDGLDLPVPISSGSGFDATVDDWDIVESDIEL